MDKLDFKKVMKVYWQPPVGQFVVVEVPRFSFLKVDGKGDPNSAVEYRTAVQWLFSMSYALKFASKAAGRDYGVAPLEGLWWAEDMASFTQADKSDWLWTAMILQPDWIGAAAYAAALDKARRKLGEPPGSLRLEPFEEGLSACGSL